jgi:hypothetical protein
MIRPILSALLVCVGVLAAPPTANYPGYGTTVPFLTGRNFNEKVQSGIALVLLGPVVSKLPLPPPPRAALHTEMESHGN